MATTCSPIVDKIIWAVVGAVVVFLLGKVGL